MGGNPVDPQNMVVANILPVLFVTLLVGFYPRMQFSCVSYALIAFFLTSHTIGSHYTYEQVPFGIWLENNLNLPRNHFDRIAHFGFGLLMAFPLDELFGKMANLSTRMRWYLVCMTLMGLAAFWEILESWGARILHPEMGLAYLGAQGDIWDPQKDMAATLSGVLIWILIIVSSRIYSGSRLKNLSERTLALPHVSDHCRSRHQS